jgi:hypothetical protein
MELHRGTDGVAAVLEMLAKAGSLETIIYAGDTPNALAVNRVSGELAMKSWGRTSGFDLISLSQVVQVR